MQYGVASFLRSIHMDKVVIGVSGGIDSAVNAALYRSVLPKDNLLLVNTPTRFNSETTKGLARQLAENLECPYVSIPIGNFVQDTCSALNNLPIASSHGETALQLTPFMMENIQARDRSSRILAALSAQFHGILPATPIRQSFPSGTAHSMAIWPVPLPRLPTCGNTRFTSLAMNLMTGLARK